MKTMSKNASLILTLILASSSLIMIKTAYAAVPKPSVPEFAVQPIGPSYDVPPTYSLDPNTGQFVTQNGYHVEYSYAEITIKNQAFPAIDDSGNPVSFYYNVRIKGHDETDNWLEVYYSGNGLPTQSDSNYTKIPIPVERQNMGIQIPAGSKTDIQVQAMIGRIGRVFNPNSTSQIDMYPYRFIGETSGWSNTQTVTLPANTPLSPTPSASHTSTPTLTPDNSAPNSSFLLITTIAIVVMAVLIAGLVVAVVVLWRKVAAK
jgi:hypothetical protein